jgi:hypothetical protein
MTLERAKNIRATIRGYLGSSTSGLVAVPEIEGDDLMGVARKLQVQVFALTDALVDTVDVLDKLVERVDQLERRRR